MVHVVWLIGALIVLWGVTAILRPEWIRRAVKFFSEKNHYLVAAFVRLLLGILFLVFAYQTRTPRVILIFGLLFLAGGILLLVMPATKRRSIFNWWTAKQLWVFRLLGAAVVVVGVLIIWAGWPIM